MCGIVGFRSLRSPSEAQNADLTAAIRSLGHRGPDGKGQWFNNCGVGLGHTRLAILDLSPAGAQPMGAMDEEIIIVLNGEIYNYAEIGAELASLGHQFRSGSDTEVALAAFREWGFRCVERFIGMFAFAIWDGPNSRLSLCRDRIGVKPLYYSFDGEVFTFASELKALRAFRHVNTTVNAQAVGEFLQYGYIGSPRTIYENVHKVPPGNWLHFGRNGEIVRETFWSLRDVVNQGVLPGSDAKLEESFEALLESACRYRILADVPVGLFLSGGVDSSLVASTLRNSGVEIETFTIGFESHEFDESASALAVANGLSYRNHAKTVTFSDFQSIVSRWADIFDEPHFDLAGIPMNALASFAREKVTVGLAADGGDELFCGYAHYPSAADRMALHQRLPNLVGKTGASALEAVLSLASTATVQTAAARISHSANSVNFGIAIDRVGKLSNFLGSETSTDALRGFRSIWQVSEIATLIGTTYRDPRTGLSSWPGLPIEEIAAVDFHEYLQDDVLVKSDRATMAAGLEAREPLLDHRLVEMAFRLPLHLRYGALGGKHLLKKILYRHIPQSMVDRPKQGFSVPLMDWMKQLSASGEIQESFEYLINHLGFDRARLSRSLHIFANSTHGMNRIWLLYVLGNWAKRWL